ncbi:MAG TPA: bifunctional alpha/beta hydrolase/class I SAM-dependent methyltransferase [Tepidisphaeraceae bacterium]|jgi:alpha-beta hydrolase superfamily lysophospholipase/SAM-dependent methyltransferase
MTAQLSPLSSAVERKVPKPGRQVTEHTFTSWDGTTPFYRAWLPDRPATRALLLFHRGHEHSGRWQETVDALNLPDVAMFAWDQRGHGRSSGERGRAPNLAGVIKDVDCFARHVARAHGVATENTAVLASSVGAVIAAAWVHDFAPPIRGMVLAAPALRVKLYVPLAIPFLRLKEKFLPGGAVKSYVKARMLTHDVAQAAAYDADPLIFRQIAVNILLDLHDTATRLVADAAAIGTPTLILAAGSDWVVQIPAQREFYRRLGSRFKQMEVFPGFYHSLFHEKECRIVVDRAGKFLEECLARSPVADAFLDADKGGFSRTEYDLLRAPGSLRWPIARAAMKLYGGLSTGIRLGWRAGFDSGVTLDYVYENKPRGVTPLGRLIDYFYLNAVGWRGIRVRRQNLERLLAATIDRVHRSGRPVHILDIASGPGRYILETMHRLAGIPISASLRDYRQANLDAARKLADQLQLPDVTVVQGDAFDRASLAQVTPGPTIAVVSGLYELFPDNAPVLRSLQAIADAVEEGGYLLYTCQPWHPQVELIARTLTNREGKPWIMRRRSQGEMDALVRAAGFEKLEQDIDRWGIFTVSVARRVSR